MTEQTKTYSIALRLRRTTYEDAYVAVPVTSAIVKQKEDGTYGIDYEAFVAEAIRLGSDSRVEWQVEATEVNAHPIQGPKPEDRQSFDGYYP
ncbi:MAG: hypothetical protein HUU38_13990 [Anaerolineales bacterium]|nr:hypothetical protein [Anaerolineales bacterium]